MESRELEQNIHENTRVARRREAIIQAPQEVCVERARYLTESMTDNWNRHPLARMSLALERILNNITVTIRDDELIVGCRTSKLKGAPLFPENKIRWIEPDVDNLDQRVIQKALITEEEKREIRETITPFWKGKTVEEYFESLIPDDVAEDLDKYIFTMMLEINYGIGHFTMDYPRIMASGLRGIISETKERLEKLSPEERDSETGLFYDAVIRSLTAAVTFANRYGDLAETMAKSAKNKTRKEELNEIARICRRVPEHPPESFHEAVQFLYFIHLISQIETGGNSISLGRIDQFLYPWYRKDVENGKITPDGARELLSLMFLKTNEIWNVLEEVFIPGGEGPEGKTTQNVTFGGVGENGKDATNDLSYVALEAYNDIRTVQPNVSLRIDRDTPSGFIEKAVEYTKDGMLAHFFNDEVVVPMLEKAGHTTGDARNYALVGCVEPNAQGKTFGSTFAVQFNGIKCLEFALSDGIDNIFGYQSGIQSGNPRNFTSYDDLWKAYDAQVTHYIGQMDKGMQCLDRAIAERLPSPFASAVIRGCLEKGKDATSGGAVYNSTGVQFIGFSNTVDSLYGVRKAVFEENTFTIDDLVTWLEEDWMDAEDKQQFFLKKIDKYGNNIDEVDAVASDVLAHYCDVLSRFENFRGGAYWPGVFSVGFHIAFGAFTAATPDGRGAGAILGNGITPSNSSPTKGPTAVTNSAAALPLDRAYNGINLNMRFSGKWIEAADLVGLITGYFKNGGVQVQFNMVDSDILREAMENPDRFRDLMIRISGYSVVFVNLSEDAQEEIISRIEYKM